MFRIYTKHSQTHTWKPNAKVVEVWAMSVSLSSHLLQARQGRWVSGKGEASLGALGRPAHRGPAPSQSALPTGPSAYRSQPWRHRGQPAGPAKQASPAEGLPGASLGGQDSPPDHQDSKLPRQLVKKLIHLKSTMMKQYLGGNLQLALKAFEDIKSLGVTPNFLSYVTLLEIYIKLSNPSKIHEVYQEVVSLNYIPSISMYCNMITFYAKVLDWEKVIFTLKEAKFYRTEVPTSLCLSVINRFYEADKIELCWAFEREMEKIGIKADIHFWNRLLNIFGTHKRFKEVQEVLMKIKNLDIEPNEHTFSILFKIFSDSERVEAMFQSIKEFNDDCMNGITLNTLLQCFVKKPAVFQDRIIQIYKDIKDKGQQDVFTYCKMIEFYSKMKDAASAGLIWDEFKASNIKPNHHIFIQMFVMARKLEHLPLAVDALKFFFSSKLEFNIMIFNLFLGVLSNTRADPKIILKVLTIRDFDELLEFALKKPYYATINSENQEKYRAAFDVTARLLLNIFIATKDTRNIKNTIYFLNEIKHVPSSDMYIMIAKFFLKSNQLQNALNVWEYLKQQEGPQRENVYNTYLASLNHVPIIHKFLNEMIANGMFPAPEVCDRLLNRFGEIGDYKSFTMLIKEMNERGIKLTEFQVRRRLNRLEKIKQVELKSFLEKFQKEWATSGAVQLKIKNPTGPLQHSNPITN